MEHARVKVVLFATLREKYRVRELEVSCDGTVRNLVQNAARSLGQSFGERVYDTGQNKVRDDLIFTINGRNIKDIKGEIKIKDGDTVAIFPPIAGG